MSFFFGGIFLFVLVGLFSMTSLSCTVIGSIVTIAVFILGVASILNTFK